MKPIELKEFLNFTLYSGLTYSPEGKSLAFVESKPNEKDNDYKSNLRLYRDEKVIPLVNDGKVGYFFFEDEDHILFAAKREDKDKEKKEPSTILYRLSLSGGEAQKAYEFPLQVSQFKKLPNGDYLFHGLIDKRYPNLYKLDEKKRKKFYEDHKEDRDYEELDESPFFANGAGYVNHYREAIFYWDVKNNKLERLSGQNLDCGELAIRGDEVFFAASAYKAKSPLYNGLYKFNLKDKKIVRLVGPKMMVYSVSILKDRVLILGTKGKRYGISENPQFFLLDEAKNDYTMINDADESMGMGPLTDVEYGSTRFDKVDGDYYYFLSLERTDSALKRIGIDGKIETVVKKKGSITDFDVKNGQVAVLGMFGLELPKIALYENKKLKVIANANKDVFKDKYLAEPEFISAHYGEEDIDGWILKPIDFDPSKKYPAILDIHGGPKCAYGPIFFHEMQYWASKGYFVMFCNPHGSDGRGNEFASLNLRWGDIDYKNIMAFVDKVLESVPEIDPKRVCCTGGSYGGYMSNWINGHTDRFCCIATQRSIANWITMYGVSDIPPVACDETCNTHPYSEKGFQQMWDASPLKYVKNAKTPTLFIHSDEDHRCPIEEGWQFYTALVYQRVPCKMVVFHGENHELSRTGKPKHRVKRLDEITKWFDKYSR